MNEETRSPHMRVLWLTNIPMPAVKARQGAAAFGGGGWLSAGLEALSGSATGIDVVCAALSWPAPEPFDEAGVRYVTLPTAPSFHGWRGVFDAWFDGVGERPPTAAVRHIVHEVAPDLVHVHGTETSNAPAALMAAETSTPVLVSIQGPVSMIAPVFLEGFTPGDVARDILTLDFLKGRGVVHQWRRMRRAAARERRTLPLIADAAGRTDWDRDIVLRANPSVRYHRVGEVLREPFYATRWLGRPGHADEPTILSVTSSAPYKGIDILLRAFARLRESRPCRLRIVGDVVGTPLWRSLGRLERELGLTGHVDWVGPCDAATVAGMIAGCDVFACASRIENSPNSVCEAMLVGAPVVASRVGGIPSLIADGHDGLLFDADDDAGLAAAIARILNDPDLARALGARARTVAAQRHDPARVAREMETAYADTIARTVR